MTPNHQSPIHQSPLSRQPNSRHCFACGLENQNQISLEYLLDPTPGMERVIDKVVDAFGATFGFEMQLTVGILQI